MKDCEWILEKMSLYLDGELNGQEKGEITEHLENCEDCKKEFDTLKTIVEDLNNTEFLPLPKGYHDEVMEKINEKKVSKVDFVRKKPKNWKKYSAVAAALVFTVVGIGAMKDALDSRSYGTATASSESMAPRVMSADSGAMSFDVSGTQNEGYTDSAEAVQLQSTGDYNAGEVITISEELSGKKIRNGSLDIEIENFDDTLKVVQSMVESNGGYIEDYNSYIYFEDTERGLHLKAGGFRARVDKNQYNEVLEYLRTVGKVSYENEYVYDITSQYVDIEARLKAKKTEEERLLNLMNDADTVQDIIVIEARVAEVRGIIENYEMQIKGWDRDVEYSTIYVSLTEKNPTGITSIDAGFSGRIQAGFVKSINFAISGFQSVVVFLALVSVPALVVGVIGVILFSVRKRKKQSDLKD